MCGQDFCRKLLTHVGKLCILHVCGGPGYAFGVTKISRIITQFSEAGKLWK